MRPAHLFVIFGATGDLTRRKLLPAVYRLITDRNEPCVVLGVATSKLADADFRADAAEALIEAGFEEAAVEDWCGSWLFYEQVPRDDDFTELRTRIEQLEEDHELPGNRTYYLALPPAVFPTAISHLGAAGLHEAPGWVRLVVEKPFGRDLASAQELNHLVHRYFDEADVYRIDHYLGKETVQNLLVFRFANSIFESSWNRDRIERVEITVAEDLTVGSRARYYEQAGVVRDMVQNHLTQLFTLIAMEPPVAFNPTAVRNEKVKVLEAVQPIGSDEVAFGQYTAGQIDGRDVPGYLDEESVAAGSKVPTFVAMRLWIDNWRWQGVPFYLRTGKALPASHTHVAVTFRDPPVRFFASMRDEQELSSDVLLLELQPDEGFELRIDVKRPGDRMRIDQIGLSFDYAAEFGDPPEAYETLLADIIDGDQTLFVRGDEVEMSWRLYEPVLDPEDPEPYAAGSWGPPGAEGLLEDWVTR